MFLNTISLGIHNNNSLYNWRYFFTFFMRVQASAKLARRARRTRRVTGVAAESKFLCFPTLHMSGAPRSPRVCLRSHEKREKITPFAQAQEP